MSESNNSESLSGTRRLALKRHNAKHCALAIRRRIVNALANGDSKRAIARALRVSNNTVTAIAEQEWQQVESRKARIAAQAEQVATRAADRLNAILESDQDISPQTLVPIFGVAVDKLALLRGEPSLTIQHTHTHNHQVDVQRFNAAIERIEKRAIKARVVEVPALPAETRDHSEKTPRKKRAELPHLTNT